MAYTVSSIEMPMYVTLIEAKGGLMTRRSIHSYDHVEHGDLKLRWTAGRSNFEAPVKRKAGVLSKGIIGRWPGVAVILHLGIHQIPTKFKAPERI